MTPVHHRQFAWYEHYHKRDALTPDESWEDILKEYKESIQKLLNYPYNDLVRLTFTTNRVEAGPYVMELKESGLCPERSWRSRV